jgi:hypothetical protein
MRRVESIKSPTKAAPPGLLRQDAQQVLAEALVEENR